MQELPEQKSESLRAQLHRTLYTAAKNGKLLSALKDVIREPKTQKAEAKHESLRAQLQHTLSTSAKNGQLQSCMKTGMGEEEILEPETKRRRLSTDLCVDTMKVHVVALGGREFDVNMDKEERVVDMKQKILKEQGYQLRLQELRLILGTQVLDDMVVLSDTSVKDGDHLTLVKHVGVMQLLLGRIYDDTQWHGRHKFALRSEPLFQEVEKIEVTVGDFQDQGWGGCQARLFIYLHDPSNDKQIAAMKIFGPLRTSQYDERKHKRSPSCTIEADQPIVALARPGMVYKLKYQCGGGGGHSITVKDWCCKIFPKVRSTDEVMVKVNGTVNLENDSRLGPDRVTRKWEVQEPPYP